MGTRAVNKLTDRAVRTLKAPGLHSDGRGLYLEVEASGLKRWTYLFQLAGKRRQMGLGALVDVSLAEAREARDEARKLVLAGKNPIIERRNSRARLAGGDHEITFGEWAKEIAPAIGPKAEKARKAWVAMMTQKVGKLAAKPPRDVTTDDVLAALGPFWVSRPETGKRMRQRIERTLDAAKAKGLIDDPWQNPARLRGHLENLLPKRATAVKHQTALPFDQAPDFMAALRRLDRMAGYALQFTILTAVRNGECRGAVKSEIDRKAKVWTIPAERMKGPVELRRVHRVPLTDAALVVLDLVRFDELDPGDLIFPNVSTGKKLSENALQNVVKDMGLQGKATVHGFRSTFRDWAGEMTHHQREVIEAALSHRLGDDTERAYRRGDALEKRRGLMSDWATYLAG